MKTSPEHQAECQQRAEELVRLLRDRGPTDGVYFWYSVAALARQIERRASAQYRALGSEA